MARLCVVGPSQERDRHLKAYRFTQVLNPRVFRKM